MGKPSRSARRRKVSATIFANSVLPVPANPRLAARIVTHGG